MKKQDKIKPRLKLKYAWKKPSVVSEAFFQILTLIISIFAFSFLIALPSQVVEAQTTACCEKVKGTGLYCQNAPSDSCDTNFMSAPTSCDSTSFCKLGCCYDSVEGTCAENTPKKLCGLRNGTFDAKADCKIAQCALGCCVLGDQASLATLVRCKKLASYYGLETDFRSGITNEADCISIAQAQDKGACVISTPTETTCKFTTRASCKSLTNNQSAFYKDFLCSAEQLATNCARQHRTGCVEGKDEVYWFDSCGNAENIYDFDKVKSYNNGRILSKEQSCNANSANANSPYCGNCQYSAGSICGEYRAGKEPKPKYGDYLCRDINCKQTSNGKDYKHGESWCVYDAAVGEGRDVVGSRHFRHLCVMGEEKVEPCDDYRQGICVEGQSNVEGNQFTESVCRLNNWRDCLEKRDSSSCNKAVNCRWADSWPSGICLPDVPSGFNFKTSEGGSIASSICGLASTQCPVFYEKKITGWKCIKNCECLQSSWTEKMLKTCASLGDCGAKVNIIGTLTKDGYQLTEGADASSGFFENYKKLIKPPIIVPLTGRAITGMAESSQNQGGSGQSGGGGFGMATLLNPVKNTIYGLTAGQGGIFWNVGISTAAAFFAGKMIAGMFGLKGEAANLVGFAGATAAAIASTAAAHVGAGVAIAKGTTLATGSSVGIASGASTGIITGGAQGATISFMTEAGVATTHLAAGESFALTTGAAGTGIGGAPVVSVVDGALTAGPGIAGGPGGATAGMASTIGTVLIVALIAIIIMIIIMKILGIGKTKTKTVTFTCLPWQPPSGGADCEKCNREPIGGEMKSCSQYRCSSLGATCSLLNEGTGKETCVGLNPNDVNAPTIMPYEATLTYGHAYIDVKPCPPGPGCWKITRTGAAEGCIKAFTHLTWGVTSNEPAQCKVEYNHTAKFDDMQFWFGDNLYLYNHSMKMSLPGPNHINAQSPELQNDGKYTLYVRCRDGNGNANLGEMAASFCVDPGPDTTPAWIIRTSIDNGAPVAYGTRQTALDIFTNEPAQCRWSRTDQAYENMNNTFVCASGLEQMEWDMTYRCSGTLTGIQDKVENTYYFRCKDQPWLALGNESDRNANKESYIFTLFGTQPLNITKVGPNGTISYGKEPVPITLKVETANGYSAGEAKCYYSETGYDNMIEFFKTDSAEHEQTLNLLEGNYTYYILCRDLGGNVDKSKAQFRAEVDKTAPRIIRVYQDAGMLKIVTDETSECRYSIKSCNFDFSSATEMPFTPSTEHTAEWRTDITYYIKCMDEFGNMPAPSECTMQVNAYDVPSA